MSHTLVLCGDGRRVLATVLLVAATLSPSSTFAQTETGVIRGTVVARSGGQPVPSANVVVDGTDRSALTDAQGHYRIAGVPTGTRTVTAWGIGWHALERTVMVPGGGEVTVDLTLAENPIQLSDLVVTATRDEERRTDVAANIGVVGGADISTSRPHHSAEIVNRIPGVLNIDLGGEGSTVAMRLPIVYHAMYGYLEDGIPIRSTGFFNHNALYEINVPGADRVEVFKGPASALYGSDAIGGVFNVLTRPPSVAPSADLFAEGAEYGYQRVLASGSGTWGAHGLRADLNLMHFGGWRDGAHQERQTATLRWDRALGAHRRLKTVITGTNIDSPGDGGSDVPRSDFENRPTRNYTPVAFRKVEALRWSTAYETGAGPSSGEVTAYARHNRLNLLPSWQLTYDPQVWDTRNQSLGLMAKYRRDFGSAHAIVGADGDYSPGERVVDEILPSTTPDLVFESRTTGARQYDYKVTFMGISSYAQLDVAPNPALHLSGGVRFDRLGYDYDNRLTPVDTGAHRRPADATVWYSHLSPKLGVTYDVSPAVNLFASYRHGFRVPSEDQLFVQGSATNSLGLQPVKTNSFEAGLRARLGQRVSVEGSAYTMDVTDDIVYFFNTSTFTSEVSNAGRTRHRGVELSAKVALTDRLRLEGAYTYVRHRYLEWVTATGSDFSGNEMEAGPRHIGNARLTYVPLAGSALTAEWARVGGYFTDPDNLHRYDGYDLLNLEATTPEVFGFALVLHLANVTDTRHAVTASFNPFVPAGEQDRYTPGMPRTLYAGLQYRAVSRATP